MRSKGSRFLGNRVKLFFNGIGLVQWERRVHPWMAFWGVVQDIYYVYSHIVSLFAHYSKPNHTPSHTCTLTKKRKSLFQQAPNKTEWNLIQVIHAGSVVWPGELMDTLIKGCWSRLPN